MFLGNGKSFQSKHCTWTHKKGPNSTQQQSEYLDQETTCQAFRLSLTDMSQSEFMSQMYGCSETYESSNANQWFPCHGMESADEPLGGRSLIRAGFPLLTLLH